MKIHAENRGLGGNLSLVFEFSNGKTLGVFLAGDNLRAPCSDVLKYEKQNVERACYSILEKLKEFE